MKKTGRAKGGEAAPFDNLAGSLGLLSNAGARTVNGLTTISLTFKGVPPATHLFGFIEQTAGGRWTWFSTRVQFPALVLQQ